MMDLDKFIEKPVLGIIRGIKPLSIKPLSDAIVTAGLETVEITMNTDNAAEMIRELKSISKGKLCVGAGTVLTLKEMQRAIKAGAEFIVMPVFIETVADNCLKNRVPFFPGAFTPQEVFRAWRSGAAMVKVFPAGLGGAGHIKAIKGPFDKIKLMAVGGIKLNNISEYLSAGADAVAFGSSIFKVELIEEGRFDLIEQNIKSFVDKVISNTAK